MKCRLLLIILAICCSHLCFATNVSFRVQCAKEGQSNLEANFNKIPDQKKFTLHTGKSVYFSGMYFNNYYSAEKKLKEIQDLGIKEAFIKIFINKMYMSDERSNELIAKYLADNLLVNGQKHSDSLGLDNIESPKMSNRKEYFQKQKALKEFKKAKTLAEAIDERMARKEQLIAAYNESMETNSEYRLNYIKREVERGKLPVFKILLNRSLKNDPAPNFKNINEIVYQKIVDDTKYYTVGHFDSYQKASSALKELKGKPNSESYKIIGLFRGKIISASTAADIYEMHHLQLVSK